MDAVGRIFKNTGVLTLSNILGKFLTLFLIIGIGRYFGKDGLGLYSFGVSFAMIFVVISKWGLDRYLIRQMSRNQKDVSLLFKTGFLIRCLFSGFILICVFAFLNILDYPEEVRFVVYVLVAYQIFISFLELVYTVFHSMEKMEYQSFLSVIERFLMAAVGLILIYFGKPLEVVILVFPVVAFCILIVGLLLVSRYIQIAGKIFDKSMFTQLVRAGPSFMFLSFAAMLLLKIDTVMIYFFKGEGDVGLYSAAYSLSASLYMISVAFNSSVFPLLSRTAVSDKFTSVRAFIKSLKYTMIFITPIAFGTSFLANRLMGLFFGPEYLIAGIVLAILIWETFLVFIIQPTANLCIALDRQKLLTRNAILATTLNIILNLAMIPVFGIIGAAITTVFTRIFTLVLNYQLISDKIKVSKDMLKTVGKIFIPVFLMSCFLVIFSNENILFLIIFGAVIYGVSIFVTGVFDREDRRMFQKIF